MTDISRQTAIQNALTAIRWNLPGPAIEQESFRIIGNECRELLSQLPPAHARIARRLIHASADPRIARDLHFASNPVCAGLAALRKGAPIFCDANMIRSGLSLPRLKTLNASYERESILCFVADEDVAAQAAREGRTRAVCAAEKALPLLDGAVVLIGNAPLALARIARAILEEGLRPALVIGMPVGFVNVTESKELLALCDVAQIVLRGRRGGSPLAVAALHAVIESAAEFADGRRCDVC